jgi:sucrose-6-phosphate hydrolase SacC (GH32 family)
MYYKGYYHLFYQYNPDAAVWGHMAWGHAVSTALMLYLENALEPDQWYDDMGVWSGSATNGPDDVPFILYTGKDSGGAAYAVVATCFSMTVDTHPWCLFVCHDK